MSGIIGLWNPDGRPAAVEEIARMSDAISHRGPDGRPRLVEGPVALGYLHLEVRSQPLPVVQPLADGETGLAIVLDGRIDNREDLVPALESRGLAPRGGSDAELILRAYQLWGVESPARLLGDFAFAIWDSRNRRFFCARDQLGVKPFLYYFAPNSLFAFASEIKGIIALDRVPRRLNEFRLADYLVNELDREDTVGTFYEGVQRLPGGHCLMAERDSVKVWDYWKLVPKEGTRYRSMQECGEAYRSVFMKAVSDRIRDTAGVAYALSGGLDSSSVVGAARELSGGAAQANLATFSLVDDADQEALGMIRSVVEQGGIDSHLIRPEEVTAGNYDLAGLIRNSDQPFEVEQGFFDWVTYRSARQHGCRVLLDGIDGDQMHPHGLYLSSMIRRGHWLAAIRNTRCLAREWKEPWWRILAGQGLHPVFPRQMLALGKLKRAMIKPPPDTSISLIDEDLARRTHVTERCMARRQALLNAACDPCLLHSLSFTSGLVSFALEGLGLKTSLLGLELRHPFVDRRVVEFLISLPLEWKGHFPASKTIMRTAMAGLLPEPLLRQRRLPHPGPAFHARILACHAEWLQKAIQQALQNLEGYVRLSRLSKVYQVFMSEKQADAGFALWNVAVLADWMGTKGMGDRNYGTVNETSTAEEGVYPPSLD
jgi:asparagine synthase (glutamine-hydrolysing)